MTFRVAVVENNTVTNIVVADTEDAVQALPIMLPDAGDFLVETNETGIAYIGGDLLSGKFRAPSPFASWVFNQELWKWESPVPYPDSEELFEWNEETQSWDQVQISEVE